VTEGPSTSDTSLSPPPAAKPNRVCIGCGATLDDGLAECPKCHHPALAIDVRHVQPATRPIEPREISAQYDRLLVLAAVLAFLSLYLPWLPGLYGAVPGWRVPYSTPDIPLDEIRHLEQVIRPNSLYYVNFIGVIALIFCRTSKRAGVRDFVASVILAVGGGYFLVYFIHEWGWCLRYSYVGPYATFMSLALFTAAGLWRTKYMPWVATSKVFLLVASAFLLTGFFLPWSLDFNGIELMLVARSFYWLGIPSEFAYVMPIFPLMGFVGFIMAFREYPKAIGRFWQYWALVFGLAALIYFRVMWATYLVGWPLGSWGVLMGLTLMTVAGFLEALPQRPIFAKVLIVLFLLASAEVWFSFLTGDVMGAVKEFFGPAPRFF
jgi:hypothetical protein